jgi:acyl-coenzyme A synthetase/AMP-(fatty) acid ligase
MVSTMVLVPSFEPDAVLDAIELHRCTTFFGVPFMCAEVSRRQNEKPRNLQSLRLCTVAGDVCSAEIEQSFEAVVGLPDATLRQRVGGAVVLAEGQPSTVLPETLASVRREIAEHKVPEKLVAVAAIPRNSLT